MFVLTSLHYHVTSRESMYSMKYKQHYVQKVDYSAHYKVIEPGVSKQNELVATLKKFCGRHHDLVNPYNVRGRLITPFILGWSQSKNHLAQQFNLTYRYIDD